MRFTRIASLVAGCAASTLVLGGCAGGGGPSLENWTPSGVACGGGGVCLGIVSGDLLEHAFFGRGVPPDCRHRKHDAGVFIDLEAYGQVRTIGSISASPTPKPSPSRVRAQRGPLFIIDRDLGREAQLISSSPEVFATAHLYAREP